jgi:hypothetical protein
MTKDKLIQKLADLRFELARLENSYHHASNLQKPHQRRAIILMRSEICHIRFPID